MNRVRRQFRVWVMVLLGIALGACGGEAGPSETNQASSTVAGATTTTTTTTTTTAAGTTDECGRDGEVAAASIVRVTDWVRLRSGPSTGSAEIAQVPLGQEVTVAPDTLSYDGSRYWWVSVDAPGFGCGFVATEFLQIGPVDDRSIAGVSFEPPDYGWEYQPRVSRLDPVTALLAESFATDFTITPSFEKTIEDQLANQLAFYEAEQYDIPADWYTELSIPGADRAVRYPFISGSGDLSVEVMLIEVEDVILEVGWAVYVEDVPPDGPAPTFGEFDRFLRSFRIDREAFLSAMRLG